MSVTAANRRCCNAEACISNTPLWYIAGQGRVFQCLQENIAKSGFGEQCQVEVQKREARMQDDYRLDYGIASQCEADVEQLCSLEKVWCCNIVAVTMATNECKALENEAGCHLWPRG